MSKSTRQAFGEALAKLGAKYPDVVVLDADLSKSTKSDLFAKVYPDRFFEMGIAEANMIGTAAGLALAGKIPFACSFGCFLTGRYDIIRVSVAYSQAPVRLVGTHSGVGIGDDGHTQMGIEDISLMRALPTMGVFQPMDARETELIVEYLIRDWKHPAYLRLTRQNVPDLFPPDAEFHPGKLMEIHPAPLASGAPPQAICIASGATVAEAVEAAVHLAGSGISMAVWNASCLKPFDSQTLLKLAAQTQLLVSVEDHTVLGGLGSIVAETLAAQDKHPPLLALGIQDRFGESGEGPELYEFHGISAKAIARAVSRRLEAKK